QRAAGCVQQPGPYLGRQGHQSDGLLVKGGNTKARKTKPRKREFLFSFSWFRLSCFRVYGFAGRPRWAANHSRSFDSLSGLSATRAATSRSARSPSAVWTHEAISSIRVSTSNGLSRRAASLASRAPAQSAFRARSRARLTW